MTALIRDSSGRAVVSICETTGRFNAHLRDTAHDQYEGDGEGDS